MKGGDTSPYFFFVLKRRRLTLHVFPFYKPIHFGVKWKKSPDGETNEKKSEKQRFK
jgi:hypothetical protein